MRIKRILASVLATAIAVSATAISVSAADPNGSANYVFNDGKTGKAIEIQTVYDPLEDIKTAEVKFEFTTAEKDAFGLYNLITMGFAFVGASGSNPDDIDAYYMTTGADVAIDGWTNATTRSNIKTQAFDGKAEKRDITGIKFVVKGFASEKITDEIIEAKADALVNLRTVKIAAELIEKYGLASAGILASEEIEKLETGALDKILDEVDLTTDETAVLNFFNKMVKKFKTTPIAEIDKNATIGSVKDYLGGITFKKIVEKPELRRAKNEDRISDFTEYIDDDVIKFYEVASGVKTDNVATLGDTTFGDLLNTLGGTPGDNGIAAYDVSDAASPVHVTSTELLALVNAAIDAKAVYVADTSIVPAPAVVDAMTIDDLLDALDADGIAAYHGTELVTSTELVNAINATIADANAVDITKTEATAAIDGINKIVDQKEIKTDLFNAIYKKLDKANVKGTFYMLGQLSPKAYVLSTPDFNKTTNITWGGWTSTGVAGWLDKGASITYEQILKPEEASNDFWVKNIVNKDGVLEWRGSLSDNTIKNLLGDSYSTWPEAIVPSFYLVNELGGKLEIYNGAVAAGANQGNTASEIAKFLGDGDAKSLELVLTNTDKNNAYNYSISVGEITYSAYPKGYVVPAVTTETPADTTTEDPADTSTEAPADTSSTADDLDESPNTGASTLVVAPAIISAIATIISKKRK